MVNRKILGIAIGAAALAVAGSVLAIAPPTPAAALSPPAAFAQVGSDLAAAQSDLAVVASVVAAQPTPTVTVTVTVTATPSTTIAPTPTPSSSTPPSTQPGPGNTGVPAGTALTVINGDLTITQPGATYSGLDIHGYVVVKAPNVTIKDSIVRGGTGPIGNGIVNDTDNAATNFVLEDSEVVPAHPVVNLDDVKGWNYTLLRDNIHGSVDGLKMYGNNATVQASWIHDLVTYAVDPAQGGGPSHSDGVQILSGSNLKVLGNTIIGQPNSSIIITQDHGPVSGVLIDGNWLGSQGTPAQVATIKVLNKPLASMAGITITNNRFEAPLASACQILDSKAVTLTLSSNVIDATGAAAKFLNTASVT